MNEPHQNGFTSLANSLITLPCSRECVVFVAEKKGFHVFQGRAHSPWSLASLCSPVAAVEASQHPLPWLGCGPRTSGVSCSQETGDWLICGSRLDFGKPIFVEFCKKKTRPSFLTPKGPRDSPRNLGKRKIARVVSAKPAVKVVDWSKDGT